MKRADVSIQIVVIAILALLVLVVLIFIFTGKVNVFNLSASSCEEKGGICKVKASDCIAAGMAVSSAFKCKDNNNPYCCIPIGK